MNDNIVADIGSEDSDLGFDKRARHSRSNFGGLKVPR
jgi:hypothetical protein